MFNILILALMITFGCGAGKSQVDNRRAHVEVPERKEKKPKKEKHVENTHHNTEVTVIIQVPDQEDEEVIIENEEQEAPEEETTQEDPTDEPIGSDDESGDTTELLTVLFPICAGIIVHYGDNIYYLGEKAAKINQSWKKVTDNGRLRLGYQTVEKQIKTNGEWVDEE